MTLKKLAKVLKKEMIDKEMSILEIETYLRDHKEDLNFSDPYDYARVTDFINNNSISYNSTEDSGICFDFKCENYSKDMELEEIIIKITNVYEY
ncbi:hypothetical protein SAMN02745174_02502 [Cetobacterium ceti]|uniref:Uncharacterized protein n=1 Tax=Cetobacterium ceti TaxID=180163 RepID=A0A1T4QYC0_9FUSO|nr:hypothetical protein [Cetobacterium ceti]SKA08675.1 hypothetical protein SAMN02745174_02502 [Cetobacterium ceti]